MKLLSTASWFVVALVAIWVAYEFGKLRRTRRWLREVEEDVAERRLNEYTARVRRNFLAELPSYEPARAAPRTETTVEMGVLYQLETDGNRRSRILPPLQ